MRERKPLHKIKIIVLTILSMFIFPVSAGNAASGEIQINTSAGLSDLVFEISDQPYLLWECRNKVVSAPNLFMEQPGANAIREIIAVGAARNLDYLIGAGKPKVTLQNELNLGSDFPDLRYQCVREYSPVRLRELLFERIVEVTGYTPVQ